MRILQIVQKPQRRGAELFAFQLSQALRYHGHQIRIAYLYPHNNAGALSTTHSDYLLNGKESHLFEKFLSVHPRLLHDLRQLIRRFQPDVVQVNGGRAVKYGALARATNKDRPWILIYRNIGNPQDWLSSRFHRFFYKKVVMPRLDGVVGVSRATLQVVKEFYNLSIPMIHIPRGVEPEALTPQKTRETIYYETQTPLESRVILFVGSLTLEKRLDRLLRVVNHVRANQPSLHLWLAGEGPLRAKLIEQSQARGLQSHIRFLGVKEDVASYMQAATLLLLTSDTEGIPGVILEAGLLGLPVVATRVGGVAECVLDGETGMLVDPQDERQLAQIVADLLQDPDRRAKMGRSANRWVRENFTMDKIAQRYIDFYETVLNFRRSSKFKLEKALVN